MRLKPVGFIGFGNMGKAIAEGLIRSGEFSREDFLVSVRSEESRKKLTSEGWKVRAPVLVAREAAVVFVAVKPKDAEALKELAPYLEKKPVISVMAGVSLDKLRGIFPEAYLIRTMPNVGVAVGKGVWGISFAKDFPEGLDIEIKKLLALTGLVVDIDESLMNAITALAGSGPAFVAELIDAFAEAGVKLGFKYEQALKVALYTFAGTVELMEEKNLHPALMRDKVTSPAGTTIYGLSVLNAEGVKGKVMKAVEEAKNRADQLG